MVFGKQELHFESAVFKFLWETKNMISSGTYINAWVKELKRKSIQKFFLIRILNVDKI